ncbi:CENPF protein, partial [Amia calva]|nr:CENPF protein [Amia calva]
MSWAVEEWKDGLPGKALQKIQEIEGQLDKLKKERQQKQFQLESLEAAFQKQKQKVEMEKNEAVVLKRENQSLVESCDSLEKLRQKVSHELQIKEQQVNYLEGQLTSSKKQVEKLEQDIKRYKSELDRSKQAHAGEVQLYGTPQKSFTAPATPSQRTHDSKLEDLQERYNKEVEERQRLETELKVIQVKLLNQSSVSHKEIARHQTQSSIFPWQQDQTPSRQSNSFLDTPLKRGSGASNFLWEKEGTPYKRDSRSTLHDSVGNTEQNEQLKAMNQDLKARVSELELRLQAQEKDMKSQLLKMQEMQSHFEKAKLELADKDRHLSKCRDELTKVTGQYDQTTAKYTSVEQKLKQVSEELKCQRHNADSCRRGLEQKLKDQEKEHQKELSHQQNSQHALDQQFNQMKTKLGQEVQLAKKEYNVLQSEIDKVKAQKHSLEKDMEELKQKLSRTDQILQASQTKENDARKGFEEMQKEKSRLSCQLEQSSRRLSQVEEELNTARQNLKHSHNLVEDLKAKYQAQNEELKSLRVKLETQDRSSALDVVNMKIRVSELEKIKEVTQSQMKKQEAELEQLRNERAALEREQQDLRTALSSQQSECSALKEQNESLSKWKDEKENVINNIDTERGSMLRQITELQQSTQELQTVNGGLQERMRILDGEKETLAGQIDVLKGELLNKCTTLEEKSHVYEELQKSSQNAEQKYRKDLENALLQLAHLQAQVADLATKLQQESSRAEALEKSRSELLTEYESACSLAKSKDSVLELKDSEIFQLQSTLEQTRSQHEQLLARVTEEKSALTKEHQESLLEKAEAVGQARLDWEKSQQEVSFLTEQVSSLESSLKLQKALSAELQSKSEELSKVKDDLEVKLSESERRGEEIAQGMSLLSEQANTSIEEGKVKVLDLENKNSQLREKLQALEKDIEQVSAKNHSLDEAHNALCQEKNDLMKELSRLSDLLAEKEAYTEVLSGYKEQHEAANRLCAELQCSLEDLQGKYTSALQNTTILESRLSDESSRVLFLQKDLEELMERSTKDCEEHASKVKLYEEERDGINRHLEVQRQKQSSEAADAKEKLDKAEMQCLKDALLVSQSCAEERSRQLQLFESRLCIAEHGQAQAVDALKEKQLSLNKVNVQLEMLQMDLEDKEVCLNSYDSQVEQLQDSVVEHEKKLEESQLQVASLQRELLSVRQELADKQLEITQSKQSAGPAQEREQPVDEKCAALADTAKSFQSENEKLQSLLDEEVIKHRDLQKIYDCLVLEKSELETNLIQSESQCLSALEEMNSLKEKFLDLQESLCGLQEENQSLRDTLDQQDARNESQSSSSANSSEVQHTQNEELAAQQTELIQKVAFLQNEYEASKEHPPCNTECNVTLGEEQQRKSEQLQALSQTHKEAQQMLTEQMERQRVAHEAKVEELMVALSGAQRDLENMQQQHLVEVQEWQQKLAHRSAEMEARLAEEKQHCEILSSELESARMQMQSLDLSSRSLLCSESENSFLQISEAFQLYSQWTLIANGQLLPLCLIHPVRFARDSAEEILKCFKVILELSDHKVFFGNGGKFDDFDPANLLKGQPDQAELEQSRVAAQCLQNELQTLRSQFDLQEAEATLKAGSCAELESKVQTMAKKNSELVEKMCSASLEKQKLADQVRELVEEVGSLRSQLQTTRFQLSDVTEMVESLEMAKGGWDEKFLQIESELRRARSEKTNLEKHILSMEADFDVVQRQTQKLDADLDSRKKASTALDQQLAMIQTERDQLKEELSSCTEEKEQLHQAAQRWRGKAEQLEKDVVDAKELIKILEEDVRNLRNQRDSSRILEQTIVLLSADKEELLTELTRAVEEKSLVSREAEALGSKIKTLEVEICRLTQSLESSLSEKGQIASRLNSTQDEVSQLRTGIEKLSVRIKADEKKKRHMAEELKASQRRADSLQDRIEALEREVETADGSLEDLVLQAESAKADLETSEAEKVELRNRIEGMTIVMDTLKAEKETLESQLLQKDEQVVELQSCSDAAAQMLENLKEEKRETEVQQESTARVLESRETEMRELLRLREEESESAKLREQELDRQRACLETENTQLSQRLQDAERSLSDLQTESRLVSEDCVAKSTRLSETQQERDGLQHEVATLEALYQAAQEKLQALEAEKEVLEKDSVCLHAAVTEQEQSARQRSEEMQVTIHSLEEKVQEHQAEAETLRQRTTELSDEVIIKLCPCYISLLQACWFKFDCLNYYIGLNKACVIKPIYFKLSFNNNCCYASSLDLAVRDAVLHLAVKLSLYSSKLSMRSSCSVRLTKVAVCFDVISGAEVQLNQCFFFNFRTLYQTHKEILQSLRQELQRELSTAQEENSASQQEMDGLKSSKEELNSLLKESERKLEQFSTVKVPELQSSLAQLTKERDSALSKMQLWMKSCKQVQQEKEALLTESKQQEEKLARLQASNSPGTDGNVEYLSMEIQELTQALEDKTREAEDSMDKYCSLMISLHKLEEANDNLRSQLAVLTSQTMPHQANQSGSPESSAAERAVSGGQSRPAGKRQRAAGPEEGGGLPEMQADGTDQSSSKRLRTRSKTPLAVRRSEGAGEEELKQQLRFADIPSGELSPFILRRTTVQRCSPRLAAKRSPLAQPETPGYAGKHSTQSAKHTAVRASGKRVLIEHLQTSPVFVFTYCRTQGVHVRYLHKF